MERWQWQVVEAVYVATQGEKAEAVARLHRMELSFRKTGHVAGEITATGCRGLVQASIARNMTEMLAAKQLVMRSVYLAQEQKQQAEEVAAAVADKCALQLSLVVAGEEEYEEAVGWYRLQRAPEKTVPSFRLLLVINLLLLMRTRGRKLGFRIHEAHLQVREAAREVMMMSTSIMDDGNHWPVCGVLSAYERVAEAAVKRQQLSRALDMLREALALGSSSSSSSSVGPFLSVGVHDGWHMWAWLREEAIRYRMGRLLVKLRPDDKIHLAEALAMFANSLQCALRDYGRAADEECRLRRANAAWWARLTIQVLQGCPPPHFAEAATCSVLEELVGPGRQGASPISPSQEVVECLVEVAEVLVFFPPWQALVMRHMEAVRDFMRGRSGGSEEDDAWLLFRCTHTLATACRRAGDRRTAARHFMRCQDMGLKQLMAAGELMHAGKVEAAVRRVQRVLSLLTAPPADESSPWPRPKNHAGLLAHAGTLLHFCGHKDAALVTLSQAWDVLKASGCSLDFVTDNYTQQPRYMLSEDETRSHGQQPRDRILMLRELEDELLDTSIKTGLSMLLEEYVRSGEEAAADLDHELDAAVNWYHKAADVAHTLATACRRAGDRRTAARHFMRCQDMGLKQLIAASALKSAGEVEAAMRRVQQVLSLLTAPPGDESSPWPRPKLHAGLLAHAGNLLHLWGHKDAALVTLSQAWDVLTASGCSLDFITDNPTAVLAQQLRYLLSEDETSSHGQQPGRRIFTRELVRELEDELSDAAIKRGLLFLLEEYLRSGEEAAAALELDAAVNWYHKAADVARVFPAKQAISHLSYTVGKLQVELGQALCALAKPEGIRLLEAVRDALLLEMEMDGASGRAVALAGEKFAIHGVNLYDLQLRLAEAYSKVAHDSSKAAQMYELCRDMATSRYYRLSMQLCAALAWKQAGDLLSAQEAVLEALEFLDPPGHASNSNSNSEVTMSNMLWGSPSDSSLEMRALLLAGAGRLVEMLWPREPKHAKRKAALEALWELCRSPANNLDVYLKNKTILAGLMSLVDVYRLDAEWEAAARLLEALAPRLMDLYHKNTPQWRNFETRQLQGLSHSRHHSRHYLQAARAFEDIASEDIDESDATGTLAIYHAGLLMSSAREYRRAGQHQRAAKMLNRLEHMIRATTSWPPPGTDDVDPKQNIEFQLYLARAANAVDTGRYDESVIWLHKAASLQEAIINDIQERQLQLPVAKHLRKLVVALTYEAHSHGTLNMDDVKGLEARVERIQKLDPDADIVCALRLLLLSAKGDWEETVEPMRELFLLMAERQEGRGGDDDSWILDYDRGHCISLALLVGELELTYLGCLGRHDKALLWAERGRMRLFMLRAHAQQHQEDDPESAMDSTPNDFDRDDGKALDMLLNTLLACGPNVALLEYSYFRRVQKLTVYGLFTMSDSSWISKSRIVSRTLDCPDIEQSVNKARDSIIARPQQKGEAAAATTKKRLAELHSLLVAPVLQDLPDSCDTLIFVPVGYLSLVPFAALYDESAGQFLIQQKQVVVAPCLRALHRLLDLQDRFFSTASTQLQQPFVAGNPFPMGLGMPQLPHAEEEAAAVADILGVKPCLGAAVTKEEVVEALCHNSVVVLASHAIVGGPKFPTGALVLQGPSLTHDPDMASSSSRASTSAASNYDLALLRAIMMDLDSDEPEAALLMRGLPAFVTDKSQVLTADELSSMRIRAGLVVLSACETGRGEVTPEGVLGLGRALLQAGAATTVLSLWKVDDQATKRLITEMFQELQKGEPVGTALRKAMLKMIQEGSSISHWAPFFIFGSPTMHLRNVTTLKAKKKMNGSPELELGDGMQQVQRPTSDATSSASSADDQATVQAVLVATSTACTSTPYREPSWLSIGSHQSAWLDSSTGAICRRLFPRGLNISWGQAEQYWTWRTLDDSSTNSSEVAVLKQVCWLDLRGRIKGALTPGTVYTLSWRLGFAPFTRGLNEHPVRFFLDTSDGQHHVVDAYLNSSSSRAGPRSRVNILRGKDGWHEYEVADFSVPAAAHGRDELEVAFGMLEHTGNWKRGLYVDSVVLRPRQALSSSTGMRSSRPPGPSLPDGTMSGPGGDWAVCRSQPS